MFTKRDGTVDTIATGWAEGRKVKIRYPSKHHPNDERLVEPYFIEPNPGGHSRYVIAHDSLTNQIRTFKIERIDHAELTAQRFEIPPDCDAANRLRHAWGVSDEDTVQGHLRFLDAAAAKRALETLWHPSHYQTVPSARQPSCHTPTPE